MTADLIARAEQQEWWYSDKNLALEMIDEIKWLHEELSKRLRQQGEAWAADAKRKDAEIERFKTDYALLTDSYRNVVNDAFRLSEEAEQAKQENEQLRENRDYWMESCLSAQESRDTASTFLVAAETEIERLREERDEARGIATRSTLRSERLREEIKEYVETASLALKNAIDERNELQAEIERLRGLLGRIADELGRENEGLVQMIRGALGRE